APAGFSYLWSNGATTQSINVTSSGNYSVTVTNANNCSAASAVTSVTVNAPPPVPVITQTGNTLFSSSSTGNQWYFNGTIITGAIAASYTYTVGGDYSVTVTNAAGCSSSSTMFTAGRNGVFQITDTERFYYNLFPNPVTSSQLTIEYQLEQPHTVGVSLFNMNGRRITIQGPVARTAGRYTLNANAVAERIWKGVYILQFTIDGKQVSRTIIKL
ncbi:MAG: T9SS type A sorting domain-containing protein, partial [Chitinophagaceae bacterium]|nr:T9SS type A sorting domain-containing protein [Chitinophagaceae bacterium]